MKRLFLSMLVALMALASWAVNNDQYTIIVSNLLGITDKTAKKYIDYLCQAFLIQLLTRHSFKSKERIRNQKAYVVETGLQS